VISRRAAVLGLTGLAGATPARSTGAGPKDTLAFRVSRDGKPVGTHILDFTHRADGLDVRIRVDIAVTFGPLTLYRYRLRALEQWRRGVLTHLGGKTDDDGTSDFVEATRDAGSLTVSGSAGPAYRAPPDALPGTHWNKAELNGPWISPQDGRLLRPAVRAEGREVLALLDGRRLEANAFALTGDVRMEIWYALDSTWAALQAPAKDGSIIRYDRL
jgi:Domain of unknown function (DUF6134)